MRLFTRAVLKRPGLRLKATAMAVLVALALIAAACGSGGSEDEQPQGATPAGSPGAGTNLAAQVVTSSHVVGPNRFALGVIDQDAGSPVLDGQIHFRFFKVDGEEAQLRSESDARLVGFDTFYIDEDTGQQVVTGETGVYVANVEFDIAGDWGVEVTGTLAGRAIQVRIGFRVAEKGQTLAIGDPAPRSRQTIASDVSDIAEIDTMAPHDPMHDITVADAIARGKPVLVLFGTPAFCETQTCGPVMQTVMLPLYGTYKEQATFIHIEPYLLKEAREGTGLCPIPIFNREFAAQGLGEGASPCPKVPESQLPPPEESWNLTTEPILFLIDGNGNIAGIFEGIVGPQEVEQALQQLLNS